MTVRIVTDSTCDLPQEIIDQYKISVVPCYVNIGEKSYRDGIDISRRDFYSSMAPNAQRLKTSAPGPDMFLEVYEKLAREGVSHVISMHIHHGLSNLANSAQIAAQTIHSLEVKVVEMGQLALGLGFMVLKAAYGALEGFSTEKILDLIKDWEERTFVYAALDTVDYLRESGRVPGIVVKIAGLLHIKPIIQLHNGEIRLIGQVRTPTQAKIRLIELMRKLQPIEQVAILHTNAEIKADQLMAELKNELQANLEIWISEVTPVLGVHVGPGGVGLACVRADSPLC